MRYPSYTILANNDFLKILSRTRKQFGPRACGRYASLIETAVLDLSHDPQRMGVLPRFKLGYGVYFYHLKHSKKSVANLTNRVMRPRQFIAFRIPSPSELQILRIVHERMQFQRHSFHPD